MKRENHSWNEVDKYKIALFFQNRVSLKIMGEYFNCSLASINHILKRTKIRNTLRQKKQGSLKRCKYWTLKDLNALCCAQGLVEDVFSGTTHLPSLNIPSWQKRAIKIYQKRQKGLTSSIQKKGTKHLCTFYSFKQVLEAFEALNIPAQDLKIRCPYRQDSLYRVQDKILTAPQLVVYLNQVREIKGLPIPIMVEGITYEG